MDWQLELDPKLIKDVRRLIKKIDAAPVKMGYDQEIVIANIMIAHYNRRRSAVDYGKIVYKRKK